MRAFLLSLRMCMIREHALMHMVKKMVDLYQASSLKESTNTMDSSPLKPHAGCTRESKIYTRNLQSLVAASLAEKCLFAQNWGKIFRKWKSGHL